MIPCINNVLTFNLYLNYKQYLFAFLFCGTEFNVTGSPGSNGLNACKYYDDTSAYLKNNNVVMPINTTLLQ